MLDLNALHDEFAKYLQQHTGDKRSMDSALIHACRLAYEQGLKDGKAGVAPFPCETEMAWLPLDRERSEADAEPPNG